MPHMKLKSRQLEIINICLLLFVLALSIIIEHWKIMKYVMRLFNYLTLAMDTMIIPGTLYYMKHKAKYL